MGYVVTTLQIEGLLQALSDKLQWAPVMRCVMSSVTPIDLYKCTKNVTNLNKIHIGAFGGMAAATGDGTLKLYYDTTLKATVTFPQGNAPTVHYGAYNCSGDTGDQIIKLTMTSGQAGEAFEMAYLSLWAVE